MPKPCPCPQNITTDFLNHSLPCPSAPARIHDGRSLQLLDFRRKAKRCGFRARVRKGGQPVNFQGWEMRYPGHRRGRSSSLGYVTGLDELECCILRRELVTLPAVPRTSAQISACTRS